MKVTAAHWRGSAVSSWPQGESSHEGRPREYLRKKDLEGGKKYAAGDKKGRVKREGVQAGEGARGMTIIVWGGLGSQS